MAILTTILITSHIISNKIDIISNKIIQLYTMTPLSNYINQYLDLMSLCTGPLITYIIVDKPMSQMVDVRGY